MKYTLLFLVGLFAGMAIWIYVTSPALAGLFVILLVIVLLARMFPLFAAFIIGLIFGFAS
jgi:hypothetical protein